MGNYDGRTSATGSGGCVTIVSHCGGCSHSNRAGGSAARPRAGSRICLMTLYRFLKSAWTLMPHRLRRLANDKRYPFRYVFDPIKYRLEQLASHDEVYDESYYAVGIGPAMRKSAGTMANSIFREFHPTCVVDVGCGTGELLRALNEYGVRVLGFERSEAALKIARAKGVEATELDLEQPIDRLQVSRVDVVISTEVAEHLPARFAETFVEYLCRTADTVVMTAATPGQGGTDHVNEQPNKYWIEKFWRRNFVYDREKTMRLRREWEAVEVVSCYYENLMIFNKSSNAAGA